MTVDQALQAMAVFPESPWVHRSVANVLVGEVERLRAIVDRLPKTADGVCVVPPIRPMTLEEWFAFFKPEAAKGTADGRD